MFFLFNKGVYRTYKHKHVYLSLNIGISCHSLTATMLAMNMSRLHLRSARNWSEMSGTHTHSGSHTDTPISQQVVGARLCEPIVCLCGPRNLIIWVRAKFMVV